MHNYRSNQSAFMTRCGTDFRHQYGIFGGESQTSVSRNATRPGAKKDGCFRRLWLEKNKLTLNTSNSKFMLIADPNKLKDSCHFRLIVNDCVIERETTHTYLGIVINEKLLLG